MANEGLSSFATGDLSEKLKLYSGESGYFGMLSAMGYGQDTEKQVEGQYVTRANNIQKTEEAHAMAQYDKAAEDATKASGTLTKGNANISWTGIGVIIGGALAALALGAIAGLIAVASMGTAAWVSALLIGAGVALVTGVVIAVVLPLGQGISNAAHGNFQGKYGCTNNFWTEFGQFFAGGAGNIGSDSNTKSDSFGIIKLESKATPGDQKKITEANREEHKWNSAIQDAQNKENTYLNVMYSQAQSDETSIMDNMKRLFQYILELTKSF